MSETSLDFCVLCGKYDTIQTYVPINSKHTVWIHVCEKCAKMGEDEVRKTYIKTHNSSAYGLSVTKLTRDTRG